MSNIQRPRQERTTWTSDIGHWSLAAGSLAVALGLGIPGSGALAQQPDTLPQRAYGDGFSVPLLAGFQLLVADTTSGQFPPGTIAQLGERILVVVHPRESLADDSAVVTTAGCDRLRRGTAQQRSAEVEGATVELAEGRGCQLIIDDNVRRMTTIAVLGDASFTVACTFDIGRDTPAECDDVLRGLKVGDAPTTLAETRTPIYDAPTEEQWGRIHMRMLMRQVREILGDPLKVVTSGLIGGDEWQYPEGGVVLFDRNGRVMSFERP